MSFEARLNAISNGSKALTHDKVYADGLIATGFETLGNTLKRAVSFAGDELGRAKADTPQTELQKRYNLAESAKKLDGEVKLLQSPDLALLSLSPLEQQTAAATRKEVLERVQGIQQMLGEVHRGDYAYHGPIGKPSTVSREALKQRATSFNSGRL